MVVIVFSFDPELKKERRECETVPLVVGATIFLHWGLVRDSAHFAANEASEVMQTARQRPSLLL